MRKAPYTVKKMGRSLLVILIRLKTNVPNFSSTVISEIPIEKERTVVFVAGSCGRLQRAGLGSPISAASRASSLRPLPLPSVPSPSLFPSLPLLCLLQRARASGAADREVFTPRTAPL